MSGFPHRLFTTAIDCGWRAEQIVELHRWCEERHAEVTHVAGGLALINDRWIAHRDFPLDDLDQGIRRRFITPPGTSGSIDVAKELVVHAYADGSGTTADRSSGAGVVVLWPGCQPQLIHENAGLGTNNHAELYAIQRVLRAVPDSSQRICIHSDSEWAMGAAREDSTWNVQANRDLVQAIRMELQTYRSGRVTFEHVPGHAGVLWNEVADRLARAGRLGTEPKFTRKLQRALGSYQP